MKQVKFGSFPLAEILPKERECLDKYLIKHFADSISFKDTLTNLSITKNTFYVGPAEIIREMMGRQGGQQRHDYASSDGAAAQKYLEVQKRAFSVMGKFYTELTNSAFYKGLMYYPIYIEKVDKTMIGNSRNVEQRFSYSFILLTNDLLSGTNRPVNEAGVINFLYIYLHLFHSPFLMSENGNYHINAGNGLASIDKESIILVMRFYKLIQKYDFNPVQVFLSIYNLIDEARNYIDDESQNGIINKSAGAFKKGLSNRLLDTAQSKFHGEHFKNILQSVVHKIADLYTKGINQSPVTTKNSIRDNAKVMLTIVEIMLDDREIFDFVDDLSSKRKTRDSRMQAVADYHHYQDIIGLFEALVKFNELDITDIIKDTSLNFGSNIILDNSIEDDSDRISKLVGVIERNDFDTAFKKFYMDLKDSIDSMIQVILDPQFAKAIENKNKRINESIDRKERTIENTKIEIQSNITEQHSEIMRINLLQGNFDSLSNTEIDELNDRLSNVNTLKATNLTLTNNLTNQEGDLTLFITANPLSEEDVTLKLATKNSLTTGIFANIDDSLGFIYKDLENIFMNPMVLDEILNKGNGYTFDSIPQDANTLAKTFRDHPYNTNVNHTYDDLVKSAYSQLYEDVDFLTETIVNELNNAVPGTGTDRIKLIQDYIIKGLGLRFFGIMKKHLRNIHSSLNKKLEYNSKMQGIHPLLGKMARDPKNFKTFILSTNVLSTLYNLIFITQEKMFVAGLLKRPPKKINGSDLQSRFIINNVLGLQNNPTWVIGENKIRLNLPDFLSLTGSPVQSEIPKNKLQGMCKVDYKEFSWKSDPMGKLVGLEEDPKVKKIKQEITNLEKQITAAKKKPEDKTKLSDLRNEKTKLEEELIKASITAGGVNLGNMGKILDGDNYSNLNLGAGGFKNSTKTPEEYDNLSFDEKEDEIDPRSNNLDYGMDSNQNLNLDYLKQTGTTNLGSSYDDVRANVMGERLRGRFTN